MRRSTAPDAQRFAAVCGENARINDEVSGLEVRPNPSRKLTTATQSGQHSTLSIDRDARGEMVELGEHLENRDIRLAGFDANGALARGRETDVGGKRFGKTTSHVQTVKARLRHHDC